MSEATSRTSAATEARMRARDDRYAARLRDRGWLVLEPATPEESEALRDLLDADAADLTRRVSADDDPADAPTDV